MDNIIRILMVEDDLSDFELAQREICKTLPNCEFQRVETRQEYLDALEHFKPDCVLSDYSLPHFNGPEALRLVKEYAPFTPLIIWTGSISEDIAVECMKAGAANYVLKQSIKRLGPAMLQALNERKTMLERKQAEEKYRAIFENSPIGIFQSTPEGRFISVNPAMAHIYGYSSPDEMINSITDISQQIYAVPAERGVFTQLLANQDVVHDFEWKNIRKDGSAFWTSTSARLVRDVYGKILYYEGFLQDITEQKKVEETLSKSERRFRALIENGLDDISLLDANGKLLWESPAVVRNLGYGENEYLERNIFELMHPDDLPWTLDLFQKLVRQPGARQSGAFRLRHANGAWHWVEAIVTNMLTEPSVNAIVVNYRDITEHKRAEEAEYEQRALAEALRDTAETLNSTLDYGEVLDRILAAAGRVVPHTAGTIMLIDGDSAYVVRSHGYTARGLHDDVLGVRLPLAETDNLRQILETRQTLIINDTHEYPGWKRMEITDWLRSNVGAPILIDGEVAGFILLDGDAVGFFNTTHAKHLESFASQAALAIHNARLLQRAQEEIVERKQAELALRESEERFSNAFEFAPIGKALVSLDGRFIKVNHAMSTILGYTDEELLTKALQEITQPDDLELDVSDAQQVLAGKIVSYQVEKRYLHKSGQVVWGLLSVSLVRDGDNRPQYFIAQVQDITERRHAEEEIRRSAEETTALLRTSLALTNLDLKAILNSIGNSAKALFKADGCRIFLMQPDGESLRCVLALQENAGLLIGLRVKLGEGVTGTVALTGNAEIINHMQDDPRARHVPGTPEAEAEAIMFAPLKQRDLTIGVLSIRRAGDDNPFSSNDLELLEAFAAMAASAVSNARLFEETQQRLSEMEALYENGLAVGQLLQPRQIGERIIETFARYLSWHHVTIRLLRPDTDELEVIAYNLPGLRDEQKIDMEGHFNKMVQTVGQGLSGSVVLTRTPLRTGNVHAYPEYVDTQAGIESGLYMPLKVGERVIGVISVESEKPNAFTEQDQRLLATLGNQAAIAFENARLYQAANQELLERTRAQSALWASETHYRQLADSITDILFELDYDLRYTHWNKASEMFSGILAEEAIGKSIQEVWGPSQDSLNREEVYRSVIKDRQVKTFEAEMAVKGKKHALEITAYPSMHGVSVVARDITERKLDETILKKRFELMEFSTHHSFEELMRRTLDEICDLTESQIGFLHLVEPDEVTIRLQTWSTATLKSFCKLDGLKMHNSLDQAGLWAEALRQRRSIIHNDFESVAGKKGMPTGHAPIYREMLTPIVRNEKIVAVIGVGNKEEHYSPHDLELVERFADYAWDITERKQMETALADERNQLAKRVEERTADLSRANSSLARALRVKDEFLANMSHELRTPLNAILGLSESLSEQVAGPLNEKQQKYLSTINESGHHLLSLINDILDLAKIEAGQITLDINKVDVNSVCQASLRMVKQLAQKKNQEVLFEIDDEIGLMWADERRLKQMIVNLLSNAVKFTPEQGKFGLEVRGNRDENRISIAVWDNGIGINHSDIDRLFKPFVQLDSSLAREATGTGLGLALVAQMAKLHGGSVSLESEPGEGSRFTIQLPWEPMLSPDSSMRLRSTGKFRAIDPNATNRPTVLIIDDTHEVVLILKDYLEMNGFKIVTAQDGVEGLTQAKLNHPDLILMDIMMPRMDGFETAQRFRADPEFKRTPIIALTALAMPNDRQRCLAAGMDEYISKPVNLKALVKLIQSILFSKEGKDSK